MNKQKAASAIGRNFDKAKGSLMAAAALAASAATHAATGKANAKIEADTLAAKAAAASTEVKALADKAKAPKAKDEKAKAAFEAMKNNVKGSDAALDEAKQMLSKGNYTEAISKFAVVISTLDSLKTGLTQSASAEKTGKKAHK